MSPTLGDAPASAALTVVVDELVSGPGRDRHPGVAIGEVLGDTCVVVDVATPADGPAGTLAALDAASTLPAGSLVHVYVAARGVRSRPDVVAGLVEDLAQHARVTITLRGLPERRDEDDFLAVARACHRVVRAASAVAVTSAHERRLATRVAGTSPTSTTVIPLASADPTPPRTSPVPPPPGRPRGVRVGVIGAVTPTSGHVDVLDACSRLGEGWRGRPQHGVTLAAFDVGDSDPRLIDLLDRRARALGVRLEVGVEVTAADDLRDVDVPVVPDGSPRSGLALCVWAAAGRRPLVARHAYALESASLRPHHLRVVDDRESLSAAMGEADRDPGSTWLSAGAVDPYTLDDAATAYRAWWHHDARIGVPASTRRAPR